jgi:CheY-like chemotaxis protein
LWLFQAQRLQALGTLSAGIAHDLGNLMAMLRGYLSMARTKLDSRHPAQSELEVAETAASGAAALAQRILAFVRPQGRKIGPVNLQAVVLNGVALLRSTLPRTIEIICDIQADLPPVRGDTVQIQQVLINLCINAAQSLTESKGQIRVSVGSVRVDTDASGAVPEGLGAGEYVRLRVRDTGCGMDAATQERIFQPFFTTKPDSVGAGLGLSISRDIVTAHCGRITVESEVGKGSEFAVYFPTVGNPRRESTSGGAQTVLFLDDDPGLVLFARWALGKAGYDVVGYSNTNEALGAFAAAPQSYDAVVTDLSMPGTDGIEVARRIRAMRADVPVIVTAGYISPVDEARALASGVREVIGKSATVEDLRGALDRALG